MVWTVVVRGELVLLPPSLELTSRPPDVYAVIVHIIVALVTLLSIYCGL